MTADSLHTLLTQAVTPGADGHAVAPALALVVRQGGQVIYEAAHGWIDPAARTTSVTLATRFDLASLTKLFTTTALLALISRQRLPLSTPLVALLPEFGAESPRPIDGGQDPHSKQHLPTPAALAGQTVDPAAVTLWHLLTHTSGLPPWRDVYTVAPPPLPPTQIDPLPPVERWRRGLARLVTLPFVDEVGQAVRYSDVGLMLLGEAVARLHGGTLADAISTQVLRPASLERTGFNPVRADVPLMGIAPTEQDRAWRGRRVWGEVHDENACGLGGIAGHAGLFATAQEVARFGEAWRQRNAFAIRPDLWTQAITEQAATAGERRGLGWMLPSTQGSSAGDLLSRRAYGHTGFTGTSLWIDPERELVIALLTNRVYAGRERPGIHALRRAVHDTIAEVL